MDIKVGDYVRTNRGYIYKIKRIRKSDISREVYIVRAHGDNYNFYLRKDNIIKHSFNLIDLVEVGDIVNKSEVYEIGQSEDGQKWVHIYTGALYHEEELEKATILTHEQYNANCYKVR